MHLSTRMNSKIFILSLGLFLSISLGAQNIVTANLRDSQNGDAVAFATVSLTRDGANKVYKYVLSSDKGVVKFEGVRRGNYELKAELLGYKVFTRKISVDADLSLGVLKMKPDAQQLRPLRLPMLATYYNKERYHRVYASFKTTENDVLQDLLQKLPGIEIADDGSITSNGQTISKITIDGKTFSSMISLCQQEYSAKLVERLRW